MIKDPPRCELHRTQDGTVCGAWATWRVSIGTRKYDAQDSCQRHLSATCTALSGGEGVDASVWHPVTVTRIIWGAS